MSDADDVLAYFTEFKAGDQVRIVKQQPNGSWPTLDSLGRVLGRTATDRKWMVEYLDRGERLMSCFDDDQLVRA